MKEDLSGFIESAIAGDQKSMDELLKRVQPRIRAYILRSTLNEDLTEDIVQETMLQLLSSLKTLTDASRFWPWLYTIATNKKNSYFRKLKRHPVMHFSAMKDYQLESAMKADGGDVFEKPALRELHSVVMKTMETLSGTERSVLSLRCFDNMPYHEIAAINGCSQSTVRVQFLRARKKLKRCLTRQGLSRKAVLPALILFGKLTADETLATTVTASSVTLGTGMTAAQVTIATIKAGIVKYTVATAATVAVIAGGHTAWVQTHPHPYPQRNEVKSVHYTVQGVGFLDESDLEVAAKPSNRSRKADVDDGPYFSKGAFEQYLHFPEGPDGPMLVRMQRWGLDSKTHINTDKLCGWLQNGTKNYYYAAGLGRIYITNDPIGMLILPTDPPEMIEFLLRYGSNQEDIKYARDRKTGLLKEKKDSRVKSIKNYKTEYAYNSLTEDDFTPFWPKDVAVVDERDAMHYRGWTYVAIAGHLGDTPIQGKARIPFSYTAWQKHKPWLEIHIGDSIRIVDTAEGACLIDETSGKLTSFPSGTFFTGLGRPWTGIRAYDTLRRDAAADRIPFAANRKDETATVNLKQKLATNTYQIDYTVNMYTDVVKQIDLTTTGTDPVTGQLMFTYAQDDLDIWKSSFEEPMLPPIEMTASDQPEKHHWLLGLLENSAALSSHEMMLTRR